MTGHARRKSHSPSSCLSFRVEGSRVAIVSCGAKAAGVQLVFGDAPPAQLCLKGLARASIKAIPGELPHASVTVCATIQMGDAQLPAVLMHADMGAHAQCGLRAVLVSRRRGGSWLRSLRQQTMRVIGHRCPPLGVTVHRSVSWSDVDGSADGSAIVGHHILDTCPPFFLFPSLSRALYVMQ